LLILLSSSFSTSLFSVFWNCFFDFSTFSLTLFAGCCPRMLSVFTACGCTFLSRHRPNPFSTPPPGCFFLRFRSMYRNLFHHTLLVPWDRDTSKPLFLLVPSFITAGTHDITFLVPPYRAVAAYVRTPAPLSLSSLFPIAISPRRISFVQRSFASVRSYTPSEPLAPAPHVPPSRAGLLYSTSKKTNRNPTVILVASHFLSPSPRVV
jgi:hypothetical protein